MKNPRCWARDLDDCVALMTGEHLVSVAAWPHDDPGATREDRERKPIVYQRGDLDERGLPNWAVPGGFDRKLTVKNLVVKCLCDSHNGRLSPTDDTAGTLADGIRDFLTLMKRRANPYLKYAPREFPVDGHLLERWFMKTAISMTVRDGFPIGGPDAEINTPTLELVEMAYGLRPVSGNIGLWGGDTIDSLDEQDGVGFLPWRRKVGEKNFVAGGMFSFRGWRFVVSLDRGFPALEPFIRTIPGWKDTRLLRPFGGVNAVFQKVAVRVRWPHGERTA